jgi:peroxiredoxin
MLLADIVKEGAIAPDFTLDDQDGRPFHLSDFRGRNVLLSFHPLAWTGVCTKQMKSLEKNRQSFRKLNTVAVGVSVDSSPSKKAWAKDMGVKMTRLLSDFWPHGALAEKLGIFLPEDGISARANILIDGNGKVAWSKVYGMGELPDIDEVLDRIRKKYEPPKTPGGE